LINLILKGIKDENITVWIKRRDLWKGVIESLVWAKFENSFMFLSSRMSLLKQGILLRYCSYLSAPSPLHSLPIRLSCVQFLLSVFWASVSLLTLPCILSCLVSPCWLRWGETFWHQLLTIAESFWTPSLALYPARCFP
jgi:hypothetical protein